jgi:hypothetical protein
MIPNTIIITVWDVQIIHPKAILGSLSMPKSENAAYTAKG